MKRNAFFAGLIALLFSGMIVAGCSSGDGMGGDDDMGGSTTGNTVGTVPDNTDGGENNNSNPDHITAGNTGNSGSTDNGSDTGNSGSTGDTGNSGSSDSSGDNEGSDNTGDSGSSSDSDGWNLVFEDNFEGTESTPNTEYWTLAPKGDDTWNRYMSESYNQVYQKDGYLYIFGMKSGDQYLTGGIETRDKFDFTYGQIKCRARFLRQPQGNHTGIWMMPEPPALQWPRSGEIDIMEHLDDQKVVYETAHFWNETAGKDDSKEATVDVNNDEFNVYGVIWTKESVSFTVNGSVKSTYKNDDPESDEFSYQYPFTKPFYIILSQSLGGKGTWEGVIDDSELPAIFQIDWIKVWQKEE